jgi:hypothetical protein
MAKAKDLKAAMKDLEKNYKEVLKGAVQYATEEAKKDIHKKSLSCLAEYYENYDPNSYDRIDGLRHAFLPYKSVKSDGSHIIGTAGVEYFYDALDSMYYSGSEKYGAKKDKNGHIIEYGMPESAWVIDNYLDGIHPTTNGYPISKKATHMEYIPIYDLKSPTEKMSEYLDNYVITFQDNVYSYLAAYVMS